MLLLFRSHFMPTIKQSNSPFLTIASIPPSSALTINEKIIKDPDWSVRMLHVMDMTRHSMRSIGAAEINNKKGIGPIFLDDGSWVFRNKAQTWADWSTGLMPYGLLSSFSSTFYFGRFFNAQMGVGGPLRRGGGGRPPGCGGSTEFQLLSLFDLEA